MEQTPVDKRGISMTQPRVTGLPHQQRPSPQAASRIIYCRVLSCPPALESKPILCHNLTWVWRQMSTAENPAQAFTSHRQSRNLSNEAERVILHIAQSMNGSNFGFSSDEKKALSPVCSTVIWVSPGPYSGLSTSHSIHPF